MRRVKFCTVGRRDLGVMMRISVLLLLRREAVHLCGGKCLVDASGQREERVFKCLTECLRQKLKH